MVSGDMVNVTARLQQAAEPGEVLVGDRTRSATSRLVEYEARGGIAAKGKRSPVHAWVARSDRVSRAARDRRAVGADHRQGRGNGRACPLATRAVRERVPQLVTLFGAAGVGKSVCSPSSSTGCPRRGCSRDVASRTATGSRTGLWPRWRSLTRGCSRRTRRTWRSTSCGARSPASCRRPGESVIEAAAWTIGLALPGSSETSWAMCAYACTEPGRATSPHSAAIDHRARDRGHPLGWSRFSTSSTTSRIPSPIRAC